MESVVARNALPGSPRSSRPRRRGPVSAATAGVAATLVAVTLGALPGPVVPAVSGRAAGAPALGHAVDRVATVLDEVQTGSVDGLDYLTIAIGTGAVGPLRCRGRVLRVDASGDAAPERLAAMEQVALAAMLGADSVLVTVPLAPEACRDGRPTFTRLDLLPASP